MTPKEKCDELFDKYSILIDTTGAGWNKASAKQCALIAVDEIINSGKDVDEFCDSYWQEVKREIEKL